MKGRKKPSARSRPAPSPPPLRSIDAIDQYAARAKQSGELYDTAILQYFREHLWQLLVESADPEQAAKLLGAIIAARRQQLAETKAKPRSPESEGASRDDVLTKILEPELRVAAQTGSKTQLIDQ